MHRPGGNGGRTNHQTRSGLYTKSNRIGTGFLSRFIILFKFLRQGDGGAAVYNLHTFRY